MKRATLTAAEYRKGATKRNKFNTAPKVDRTLDGTVFDSRGEMLRWLELQRMERAKEIFWLKRQVKYPLVVNGQLVCSFIADFTYTESSTDGFVVEDFKSKPTRTASYVIKRKLMLALHGIQIRETGR